MQSIIINGRNQLINPNNYKTDIMDMFKFIKIKWATYRSSYNQWI